MIITQKSFIFNDKLNVSFTHYDRYMTDIVNICKSVSILFCLLSVYTNLKVYHFLIKKCTTPNRLRRYA